MILSQLPDLLSAGARGLKGQTINVSGHFWNPLYVNPLLAKEGYGGRSYGGGGMGERGLSNPRKQHLPNACVVTSEGSGKR